MEAEGREYVREVYTAGLDRKYLECYHLAYIKPNITFNRFLCPISSYIRKYLLNGAVGIFHALSTCIQSRLEFEYERHRRAQMFTEYVVLDVKQSCW